MRNIIILWYVLFTGFFQTVSRYEYWLFNYIYMSRTLLNTQFVHYEEKTSHIRFFSPESDSINKITNFDIISWTYIHIWSSCRGNNWIPGAVRNYYLCISLVIRVCKMEKEIDSIPGGCMELHLARCRQMMSDDMVAQCFPIKQPGILCSR